jgi:hypothetical protein
VTQPEEVPFAQYRLDDNIDRYWVDMPEVRPRTRMRLAEGEDGPVQVLIDRHGKATFVPPGSEQKVEIDTYQGEGYEAVRAEGEAYWRRRDEQNAEA